MTLRKSLGKDGQRLHDELDALLDREDSVVMFFDGRRVVTYAEGFGVSASQLELLGVELERALHSVVGRLKPPSRERGKHERIQGSRIGADRDRHGHGGADVVLRLARKIA